jgi:drug/metabolite transporter (DMT)-like permease
VTSSQPNLRANAAAAVAAVLFGASVVAVRVAVREVSPMALAFLRFGQGALVLLLALAVARRSLLHVRRRDLPYLAMLGAIFYTIFPVTFNAGMQYIPASRASLILATMPLWTVILARRAAHERLSPRQLIGVIISLVGVAVVMADRGGVSHGGSAKGDLFLVATALCGAIYNVLAKRALARYHAVTVTFYAMLFGSMLLIPAVAATGGIAPGSMSRVTVYMVLLLGVFGGALSFSLWTAALGRLSPTQVAVYINLNPLSATVLAALLLSERLSGMFVFGFIAVAAGLVIVNWTPARSAHESWPGEASSAHGSD